MHLSRVIIQAVLEWFDARIQVFSSTNTANQRKQRALSIGSSVFSLSLSLDGIHWVWPISRSFSNFGEVHSYWAVQLMWPWEIHWVICFVGQWPAGLHSPVRNQWTSSPRHSTGRLGSRYLNEGQASVNLLSNEGVILSYRTNLRSMPRSERFALSIFWLNILQCSIYSACLSRHYFCDWSLNEVGINWMCT